MAEKSGYFTTEKLGDKQELTPEGFLLCRDVVVARTGLQLYGPGETDIPAGPDGVVYIHRLASEVFRPETIASFNGKPVTNDHPRNFDEWTVNPDNWRQHAVGVMLNPRRGAGVEDDCMVSDLLFYDPDAIQDVRDGKREVSCGYKPKYLQQVDDDAKAIPGHGYQADIVGNHAALVDSARCGKRCSIGDGASVKETSIMSKIMDQARAKLTRLKN